MRPVPVARALVAIAACLALAGCSSDNKGKVEGTCWSCADQLANGKHLTAGEREIEFKADGGLILIENGVRYTGTYSLGRGSRITFHFDKPYAGGKKHVRTIRVNGDEMFFVEPDGREIRFKKVSGPPPKA